MRLPEFGGYGTDPDAHETINGRREPRWCPNHHGLRELEQQMQRAAWARHDKRKRLLKELHSLMSEKTNALG